MKKRRFNLLILLVVPILAGCLFTGQATQPAEPANTPQAPVATIAEPTAVPTEMPTIAPTPDLRVIILSPDKLLVNKSDLPAEAKYYIPYSNWKYHYTNAEYARLYGKEAAEQVIESTGRIDAWELGLLKGAPAVRAPEMLNFNLTSFKTSEGALNFHNTTDINAYYPNYVEIETDVVIGEATRLFGGNDIEDNGDVTMVYWLVGVYRNYVFAVYAEGPDGSFDVDYVYSLGQIAFDKLLAAPLDIRD